MDFSLSSLLAGFIFSVIGWSVFRAGRRNSNMTVVGLGLLLMVYSYFTPTPFWTWAVGVGLCGLTYHFWNH